MTIQHNQAKKKLDAIVDFSDEAYFRATMQPIEAKEQTELETAIQDYLMDRQLNGVQSTTIHTYECHLRQVLIRIPEDLKQKPLNEYMQQDLDNITSEIMHAQKLKTGEPVADKSKESYLRNFRQFVKWCVSNGKMLSTLYVRGYRAPQAPPKMYTKEELIQLTRPPLIPSRMRFIDTRDYLIAMVFAETGIRRRSLVNIRICDLQLDENRIQIVQSKNKSVYMVAISDNLVSLIKKYLVIRTNTGDVIETDKLFCDEHQNELKPDAINDIMRRYAAQRGVKCKGVHAFRHSCATLMVENGATVAEVAQQTGHKDLRQVQGYVHAVTAMKKEKFDKLSPLAGIL